MSTQDKITAEDVINFIHAVIERERSQRGKKMITDYEHMLISALRYALGRRTYIVELTCKYIERQLPILSDRCKDLMIKDIESKSNYGDECDKEDWMRLLKRLKAEEKGNKNG